MRPQQSVQQASRVEKCIFNNQLKEEYFLCLVSYKIKTGFDAHTLFCPVDSKFFSLKKGAYFLRILLVVNIQTYAYGPSRALGKKHKPYVSNHKITLVQVSCYFHSLEMSTWQF